MIRLDTTTRTLEIILTAAKTTNDMSCVVSYSDDVPGVSYNGGTKLSLSNGITASAICLAPSVGVRDIDFISVYNADTAPKTAVIRINDNGTFYTLVDVVMQVDDRLDYTHGSGWQIVSSAGGSVTSVFGRAGAVVANSADYAAYYAALAGLNTQAFSTAALTTAGLFDISAAAAGQIKFPATQNPSANANTLDDYEEGTWSPSLGGTATYNNAAGTYTKIGQMVLANFVVDVLNIGTGSATTVSGLPFPVTATNRGGGGVSYVLSPATAYASINPAAIAGTSTINFICASTAGVWTSTGSVYTTGTVISGTVMYTV